jgi:hypothetical protein
MSISMVFENENCIPKDISEKTLSELIVDLTKLIHENPNITSSENKKLTKYNKDYDTYLNLTKEIDERESRYLDEKRNHRSLLGVARDLPE